MALSATVFKATVQVSDMDRHHYAEHRLTLAQHPSENDERMMVRLAVFCLHADEKLAFTKGLSTAEEPDLWQIEDDQTISTWIELGQPDDKRMRKACGQAEQVLVYGYRERSAREWWNKDSGAYARFGNLKVGLMQVQGDYALGDLAQRNMELQATVQDGVLWLSDGERSVEVSVEWWQ